MTVVGIYWNGLRQSCPEQLVTGDRRWPSAIDMVGSDYPGIEGESVAFETDSKSWDHLEQLVRQEATAGHREEIWVTVVGMLRVPTFKVNSRGQVVGGYGHLNVFPAQLVVKSVLDISIKNNPTYDYRELLRRAE